MSVRLQTLSALLLWCGLVSMAVAASSAQPATAFVHVNVVPMDRERVLEDWTVVVVGDRINALGPAAKIAVPAGASIIDGRGKYLLPGLADMHAHIWEADDFVLLIANGVTTVRNMFGGALQLQWRPRIESGQLWGPTIVTAGPIIDGAPPIWRGSHIAANAADGRRIVEQQHRAGYDFLKVYSGLSKEAFEAVMQAAKQHGLTVAGHVPTAVGLSSALASGLGSIEHLMGYEFLAKERGGPGEEAVWARLDESRFAEVARMTAQSGTWNCPTLVLYTVRVAPGEVDYLQTLLERPEMQYVPSDTRRSWLPENNYLKNSTPVRAASSRGRGDVMRKKLVKALHDAGARLLLGTDYGNPFVVPGFSLHAELRNFVDAGLSPYEAIRAGTSGAAEFLGGEQRFGTVAAGRRADLLLVAANPLADVRNLERPEGVMVRGKWQTRAELDAMLAALGRKHAANAM